jgi:hypothetical protein
MRVTFEIGRPGPADPATAHLVAAEGTGARRLTLWVARNAAGDICPGWRLGPGRPKAYHCQRHGLERPLLWVQGGGGPQISWGGTVGLVAPGVVRVVGDFHPLGLRPAPGLPGWRVWEQNGPRPISGVTAYARGSHQLVEDDGLWVQPSGTTYANVPEQQSGTDAHAIDLALALPAVQQILARHGPAWVDLPVAWERCTGGAIGEEVPLDFWRHATFGATLPWEETAVAGTHSPYMTGVHMVVVGSDGLQVWVDTNASRVVGVDAVGMSGAEIAVGVVKPLRPGGGFDDPSRCPSGD